MSRIERIVENALVEFAEDFAVNPYRCYTEHGIHALFFHSLMTSLSANSVPQYFQFNGREMCLVQKEYRTNADLGKSQRQNWDISIIDTDKICPESQYDYLPLKAVVEFGLNEGFDHLLDDLQRLSHGMSNVEAKYVGHFYRISNPKLSKRDRGIKNRKILDNSTIAELSRQYPRVKIVVAVSHDKGKSGICVLQGGNVLKGESLLA